MAGAFPGADYVMPTAEIPTFAAGDTSRMIGVTVAGDATDDLDEMAVFVPSGPANATLGTAMGTITDNGSISTVTPDAEPGIDFGEARCRYGDDVAGPPLERGGDLHGNSEAAGGWVLVVHEGDLAG